MKELRRTLEEWRDRADARCGLKEQAAYQRVIDEINRRAANESIKERIENADKTELTWEHHFDELIEILVEKIAVEKDSGRLRECESFECEGCLFGERRGNDDCNTSAREWLLSPYKPVEKVPKLSRKEKCLVEFLETGWIARDESGSSYWYSEKPTKFEDIGAWDTMEANGEDLRAFRASELFSFIRWEDEEPWSIEELRRLEVEGEHGGDNT